MNIRRLKWAIPLFSLAAIQGFARPQPDFAWISSPPLIAPPKDGAIKYYGVKDPSVVYSGGYYHVFMTTAGENGWGLAYTHFRKWSDAPSAPIVTLDKSSIGPGYRAAPQIFYFAPRKLWYLIFQGGDPMYSTTTTIADPLSWSKAKPFFEAIPDVVKNADGRPNWLDFWTICDDAKCYLFFTGDNGKLYRSETAIGQFPSGFHDTRIVLDARSRDDIFEAGNTYRVSGTNKFITLVEAIGPKGRYFRIWQSNRLDGDWTPLGRGAMNRFAGSDNVKFAGDAWSEGVSHGEMLRSGADQTLSIDPCKPLRFLYQGLDPKGKVDDYMKLPYRLGVITANGPNPVSAMCRK